MPGGTDFLDLVLLPLSQVNAFRPDQRCRFLFVFIKVRNSEFYGRQHIGRYRLLELLVEYDEISEPSHCVGSELEIASLKCEYSEVVPAFQILRSEFRSLLYFLSCGIDLPDGFEPQVADQVVID